MYVYVQNVRVCAEYVLVCECGHVQDVHCRMCVLVYVCVPCTYVYAECVCVVCVLVGVCRV